MKRTAQVRWIAEGSSLLGLALLGAGCWWLSPPAALIVVGVVLLASGIYAITRSNQP